MSEGVGKRVVDALPPAVRPFVEKALAFAGGLSKATRIVILTTAIVGLAIAGYFGFHGSNPNYAILFSNLDRDDAAQVVAKLKEMKVPYHLEGEGTIEVPEAQVRELRLELAGGGLPRGGAVGFESFDKMKLGATEFEQRVLYRRALEGELGRTIGSVSAIQNARVHLVLPEKSVFVSKNEPSTASVVLKLRPGRALGQGEVNGIVHLVSSSVAGLSPDHIAVVTTDGTVLHKPRRAGEDGAGSDDERASQARALEATLEERARTMVEKVVGAGRVDVRVTADIDSSRVERVEDHYDPKNTVLRSEEKSTERAAGGAEGPVTGVPGAESNIPTGSDPGGDGADAGAARGLPIRESHTRNFEVDHVTEKRVVSGGVLRRLTVAVVVDGSPVVVGGPPRSKEEVDKIASLVRSAVGYDEKRGDAVTVEAVPFLGSEPAAAPEASLFDLKNLKNVNAKDLKKYWPVGAGVGGLLFAMVAVLSIRSRRRKKAKKALELAEAEKKKALELAAAEETKLLGEPADVTEIKDEGPSPDDLRALVRDKVLRDPASAAIVLRGWLGAMDDAPVAEIIDPKQPAAVVRTATRAA